MTVSKQLIQNIEELRKSLNEISVYDFDVYTSMELYYKIANKLNEVIKELMRFEGLVSDEVVEQNEKLIYLIGEGLNIEVIKKINQMVQDGTMDSIINHNVFNSLNNKIDENKEELSSQIKDIDNYTKNITFIVDTFEKFKIAIQKGYKNIKIINTIIMTEPVVLNTKTHLWGDFYSSKIIANFTGDEGIVQIGKNCLIEGICFYQGTGYSCYGIEANNTGHSIIRDCDICNFKRGFYAHGVKSPGNHVLSTWVHDCTEYGLCYKDGAHFARIEQCDITGNLFGVHKNGCHGIIEDNNNYEYGGVYSEAVNCNNNVIVHSWTEFNDNHCFIFDGGSHNIIKDGMAAGAGSHIGKENTYGILVRGNASVTIENMACSGNTTADVCIYDGSNVEILRTQCTVIDNNTKTRTNKMSFSNGILQLIGTILNSTLGIRFMNKDGTYSEISTSGQNLSIQSPNNILIKSNTDFSNKTIYNLGQLRLPALSTPPSAVEGNLYYDTNQKKLRYYNGTTWIDVN